MEMDPQVLWKIILEDKEGILRAYFVNRDFEIVSEERLGSNYIDASASLFPNGPLKSSLQEVLLQQLIDNKTLASNHVKISTASDQVAAPGDNHLMNFPVDDLRFSQVQVFFYMSQALAWFEKNLGFQLPFVLEAETQMGYPDKTNTAFYFQHKIRLGEGDGEDYEHIPMDPSIVIHESTHAVVEAVAGLRYDGEGGSLNEAYADFFAAVQLNNPKMGEAAYRKGAFKRNIDNTMKLQEKNGGLYHDSGIVSGLLWAFTKDIGISEAVSIAWQTLLRLNPGSDFDGFKRELLTNVEKESPDVQKRLQAELRNRGWVE